VAVRSRGKFRAISQRDWEPIAPRARAATRPATRCTRHQSTAAKAAAGSSTPTYPSEYVGAEGQRDDRADWTQPLVLSPADPHALYYASQFLFKTSDGARTGKQISGDLTRPDPGVRRSRCDRRSGDRSQRQARRDLRSRPSPLRAR